MPKLQPPQNLSSSLRVSLAMCQNMPLVPAKGWNPPFHQAELWHPFPEAVFRGEKTWWAEGSVSTGRGRGTWLLCSEALLTSNPHLPPAQTGASTRKTPFCSCANCSCWTAQHAHCPYSHSKSAVSLAIFRGKLKNLSIYQLVLSIR